MCKSSRLAPKERHLTEVSEVVVMVVVAAAMVVVVVVVMVGVLAGRYLSLLLMVVMVVVMVMEVIEGVGCLLALGFDFFVFRDISDKGMHGNRACRHIHTHVLYTMRRGKKLSEFLYHCLWTWFKTE